MPDDISLKSVELSELKPPWVAIEGDSSGLLSELRKEVTRGHVLFGKTNIRAIAKREDRDDVLFALDDVLAVVHLTWAGRQENPQWPHTSLYGSWAEFISERMQEDVVKYSGGSMP